MEFFLVFLPSVNKNFIPNKRKRVWIRKMFLFEIYHIIFYVRELSLFLFLKFSKYRFQKFLTFVNLPLSAKIKKKQILIDNKIPHIRKAHPIYQIPNFRLNSFSFWFFFDRTETKIRYTSHIFSLWNKYHIFILKIL